MMKTVAFVAHKSGENACTPAAIVGVASTYVYDSDSIVLRCVNSGNDMLIPVPEFEIVEKPIPVWMDDEAFAKNISLQVRLKFFVGYGGNPDCSEQEFTKLMALSGIVQFVCIKLRAQKSFRSEFRANLRAQLDRWIDGKSQHREPFSSNQLDHLITKYAKREYKSLGEAIYRQD